MMHKNVPPNPIMRLTTVLGAVNDNARYYQFIPYQIHFWRAFGIRFVAYFVGETLPDILVPYQDNIVLWDKTPELHSVFVAQNLRLYAPALLDLPDDEMVLITDMDMLPMSAAYYKDGLETFEKDDFIHYTDEIMHKSREIFMAYNAAHPHTWSKVFDIHGVDDVVARLRDNYAQGDAYTPGSMGWFIDQHTLYHHLIERNYPRFHVLNRKVQRLETWTYTGMMAKHPNTVFIHQFVDAHFHRDFDKNAHLIRDAKNQLDALIQRGSVQGPGTGP